MDIIASDTDLVSCEQAGVPSSVETLMIVSRVFLHPVLAICVTVIFSTLGWVFRDRSGIST